MELGRYQHLLQDLADRLTPVILTVVLGMLSVIIMLAGTCSMFSTSGPLPPPRPPPPSLETSAVSSYRYKEGYYRAQITDDAKKVGVWSDLESMKKGLAHFKEFVGKQFLRVGAKLETEHLIIRLVSRKLWVGDESQGYRAAHLILRVINKTDKHLAYRIVTYVKGKCSSKAILSHNALALEPEEKVEHTECLHRKKRDGVLITRVEVMEISPLGYHYISRLDPTHLLVHQDVAEGHRSRKLPTCRIIPWRLIKDIIKHDDERWRDVIDFYARHNCDEYSFFASYRYSKSGSAKLPAQPPRDR